jgi:peptidoglycan L-alanyl-D-glutamate endopeptidase CwlK
VRRDPTLEHLPQLTPETRNRAVQLLNAARQVGVPLVITSSRRSPEEQRRLVQAGLSKTLNSAHLRGEAFDVDVMGMRRDDIPRWWFEALGTYGEAIGLLWGGRWRTIYDPGHFELGKGLV